MESTVKVSCLLIKWDICEVLKVWSLGWEDPLEKGRATHSSFLAWRLPRTEEPGELYSLWGRQESGSPRVGHDMTSNSGTLAWKIPRVEEPSRLQSMGSRRVGHDWATSLSLFTFIHWRRKWQPTPVFLPGESQGQGSLVGCRLWGRTESDTTDAT